MLFITSANDDSGRSIRTLLQSDGDIVTRATADSIADLDLLKRHHDLIDTWLDRLNRDWATIENRISVGAGGFTVALYGADVAVVHGPASLVHLLFPLLPLAGRGVLAAGARRYLRRVV